MRNWLIKLLGGYTKEEYSKLVDSTRTSMKDYQKEVEKWKILNKTIKDSRMHSNTKKAVLKIVSNITKL